MAKYRYRIIADKLRQDIENGVYPPGVSIPSTRELAEKHGVSQLTAIRALALLAQRDILIRRPGHNYCVAQNFESTVAQPQFLTLLFRHISNKGWESYGNDIISGITMEGVKACYSTYLSAAATRAYWFNTMDFSSVISEAHQLAGQNKGFVADYFVSDDLLQQLVEETHLPVVIVGRESKVPRVKSVVLSISPACYTMLNTLKRLKYDAFVCCGPYQMERYEYQQLDLFYKELAAAEKNVRILKEFINLSWSEQVSEINQALKEFSHSRICFITSHDIVARKIFEFLEQQNISVPEQVGVVGFYGTRQATEHSPVLTCLAAAPEKLGQYAAQLAISGESPIATHKIPMTFNFGETI